MPNIASTPLFYITTCLLPTSEVTITSPARQLLVVLDLMAL